jgi:hypothetical protein
MIKYLAPIAVALVLTVNVASANTTKNQAVTVCKTYLKANIEGFKKARLGKVRSSREEHKITFSVSSDQGRESTTCAVNKDTGSIAILD